MVEEERLLKEVILELAAIIHHNMVEVVEVPVVPVIQEHQEMVIMVEEEVVMLFYLAILLDH